MRLEKLSGKAEEHGMIMETIFDLGFSSGIFFCIPSVA